MAETKYFLETGIGNGNGLLLDRLAIEGGSKVRVLHGPMLLVANIFHQIMTRNSDRSVRYIESNTRESLPAKFLIWEMGIITWAMYRNIPPETEFHVAQDMLAQGLRLWWRGNLTIYTPDVFGKIMNWPEKLLSPNKIIVWNQDARDRLTKRFGDRMVIERVPVIPKGGGDNNRVPDYIFKLSGSGFDPKVINEVLARLDGCGDILIDTSFDYLKLIADVPHLGELKMLIYPSESIMVLEQMADKGIRPKVVCLYPRGKHELENLIWAIKNNLVRTICVPQRHQRLLKRYLDKAGLKYNQQYWFIDPGEIHPLCFN